MSKTRDMQRAIYRQKIRCKSLKIIGIDLSFSQDKSVICTYNVKTGEWDVTDINSKEVDYLITPQF